MNSAFVYDAENHIVTGATVTYTYDGDGRRVKKSSGTLYWYGTGNDPLDKTDLAGVTTNATFKEYVFFGGKRIARRDSTNAVNYYFADHLGTARIVANSSGTLLDDSDFYPYGGERVVSSPSGNMYKFTGKERDTESGLDNFGARFDSSSIGRFMSTDPSRISVDSSNPQSWNRYAYANNNPLAFVDRNGKWSTRDHDEIIDNAFTAVLSKTDRDIFKQASAWVDKDQSLKGSPKHGMRSMFESPDSAKKNGEAFISAQIDLAVRYQIEWESGGHEGWSPGALFQFGEALHTTTDADSPWHEDWNDPWGYYLDPGGSLEHAFAETMFGHIMKHSKDTAVLDASRAWVRFMMQLNDERRRLKEQEEKKRKKIE